jgi:hypothetical protein
MSSSPPPPAVGTNVQQEQANTVLGSSDFEDTGVAPNFEQMVLVAEPATLTAIALVNSMTNTILCAINTHIDQKLNATKEELTATMKKELVAVKDHIMDQQLKAAKEELVDATEDELTAMMKKKLVALKDHIIDQPLKAAKEELVDSRSRSSSISMDWDESNRIEREINELLAKMKNGIAEDQHQLKAMKEELSSDREKNIIRMERDLCIFMEQELDRARSNRIERDLNAVLDKAKKESMVGNDHMDQKRKATKEALKRKATKEVLVATMKKKEFVVAISDAVNTRMDGLLNATKKEFLISMKKEFVDIMNTRINGLLNATKKETTATNDRIVTMNTQMDGQFKAMKDEFVALNDHMDRLLKAITDEITAMRIHMDDQFKTKLVDCSL